MEPLRDDQLTADLRALRPAPRPEFTAELDQRAAAGFPRRSRPSLYGAKDRHTHGGYCWRAAGSRWLQSR
jgi:hypothetical protein